jgi:phage shock protein PspC (stress-responsive transcriptional regulator)
MAAAAARPGADDVAPGEGRPVEGAAAMDKQLRRSGTERIIAGVCGGIGEHLGVDPVLVRLAWVLFTLVGGSGVLAYLIAWVIIPDRDGRRASMPVVFLLALLVLPLLCAWCAGIGALLLGGR